MTLSELIAKFRVLAFDKVEPYLFDDESVIGWLNEAVQEACIRGRLLHECDNVDICQIVLQQGQIKYQTHPKLYEITHASISLPDVNDGRREPICLISFEEMDKAYDDWRYDGTHRRHYNDPYYLIQHDTYVRLSYPPKDSGVLYLEGYRLPNEMINDDDVPELHLAHHSHLLDWALHKAFDIPDSEVFDPNKSQMAEARFTQYFGIRPDSDLRRITRHDVPHTTKAFWI